MSKSLIKEDRASKNVSFARRYLVSKGYNQVNAQQVIDSIRHDIPNVRLAQYKFILGVTRMYLDNQLQSGREIGELNKTLKYVASEAHVNEYDYNLNNESLQTIVNRFKGVAKSDLESNIAASNARQYTVNEAYKIVSIDTPEEAAKYGRYTSWCVTHNANMYDSYTHNGSGRFYFCLRKGFETEPKVQGQNAPLDSYGLSMIAVSIDMEGAVNTITCRWNHDMGGNDSVMTVEQLEQVLGRNFYQTFKPYSREELHAKGVILFDEVQELLDSGKKPKDIFDYVDNFHDGFASVKLNDKWNFINQEGKLLSNQWFDYSYNFNNGFAWVILNGKWNFINQEGKLLSNQWFDYVDNFHDGFARVRLNGKWNFINQEDKLLSNQWFDYSYNFNNGFALVILNGKWNFINQEGKLLSNQWFDDAGIFHDGFASVKLNNRYHKINTKGEIVESKKSNKTIIITEEQEKALKKAIAAQDQVGGKVNAGVMDAVVGSMCESTNNSNLETWYRGYNSRYGSQKNYLLWLTDDIDYARAYGNRVEEIVIDNTKIEPASLDEMDELCGGEDSYDYIDGPDKKTVKKALRNGLNCYCFYANSDSSYCMCLWDKSPIVSRRELSEEEFNAIEGYDGFEYHQYNDIYENVEDDTYKLGAEKNQLSPFYHVGEGKLNESPDSFNTERFNTEGCYPFLKLKYNNKFYIGQEKETHHDLVGRLIIEGEINDEEFKEDFLKNYNIRPYDYYFDDTMTGRYWGKYNVLSLWKTPINSPLKIQKVVNLLLQKLDINIKYLLIDYWDNNEIWQSEIPYKWLFNGTYDIFRGRFMQISPAKQLEYAKNGYYTYFRVNTKEHGIQYATLNGDILMPMEYFQQVTINEDNENIDRNAWFLMRYAINTYGTTKDFDSSGFILLNGELLNFGNYDEIYRQSHGALDLKGKNFRDFINIGNIRVNPQSPGIEFSKEPTDVQYSKISEMIKQYNNKMFYVDCVDNNGTNIWNKAYKSEEKENIIKDIRLYFSKGKNPCNNGNDVLCGFNIRDFLGENIETEITSDEVDLSSFNIKKKLNPDFWKDGHLDSRIRIKLLDIAEDFIDDLKINFVKPVDIVMTGSLANFNWDEKYSDIDLHIIYDYTNIDENTEFVKKYFDSQKQLWNQKHKDLTIYGFNVEVYVQDINEKHNASGLYSIEKDRWLIEPDREKLTSSKVNKDYIKQKASDIANKIDELEYDFKKAKDDEYKIRKIFEKSEKLFDEIKQMRKIGFQKSGGKEISNLNIVFKYLRRYGYLEKLSNLKTKTYDKLQGI